MKKLLLLLFVLGFTTILSAQNMPELKVRLGGSIQSMMSYAEVDTGDNQFGFGMKRVRVRAHGDFGKNVAAFIQFEATTYKLLDARITYKFSPYLNVQLGRFVIAGMAGGGHTAHAKIDIVERPVSAQKWSAMTIGADYRDYAMAFSGKAACFNYNLALHNGTGSTNVIASHKSNGDAKLNGMAVSGMASFLPKAVKGLEVGGYYGMGNEVYNEYASYSGHVYYQPGPFRVKVELVSIDKNDVTSLGYYLFGAYKVHKKIELVGRYENWDPDSDVDDNEEKDITLGAVYSMYPDNWHASRVTVAYVLQQEDPSIKNNVLYAMFQLIF